MMHSNRLCQLLNIRYPIIQGGMVWVSDWNLASACCNAGILGTLGLGSMDLDEIRENIDNMHQATQNPFAVNIPLLRPDALNIIKIAIQKDVLIFITSAGNPEKVASIIKSAGKIFIHVVPSVRGANKAASLGADAIVCEGFEAGGHNSPYETTTLALVPQVVDAVEIPVVAAGGIADGRGIAASMSLGADGVQLGTRFIATEECQAHIQHKQLIIDAADTGTYIVGRRIDMLRVLRNPFADRVIEAENKGADANELLNLIGNEFNRNHAGSVLGDINEGAFQAGQSSGIVKKILPVKTLIKNLIDEYETARRSLSQF